MGRYLYIYDDAAGVTHGRWTRLTIVGVVEAVIFWRSDVQQVSGGKELISLLFITNTYLRCPQAEPPTLFENQTFKSIITRYIIIYIVAYTPDNNKNCYFLFIFL